MVVVETDAGTDVLGGGVGISFRTAPLPYTCQLADGSREVTGEDPRRSLIRSRNREADIRFMLLTYNAPGGKEIWATMTEAERVAEEAQYRDRIRSMREEGIFLAAEEVEHYDAARTVRLRDGILSVSDGPAVNAHEFLTGYFLIEVGSFETAIEWAARIPNARTGSVEVRPVMEIEW